MNIQQISWDKVSRFSQLIAIVLFVGVFVLGFFLGKEYEYRAFTNAMNVGSVTLDSADRPVAHVSFTCKEGKSIGAVFYKRKVELSLSDKRALTLPQTISASGARYANADESVVFWNKGTTAFVTEGTETTFADCVTKPLPQ